MYQAGASYQSTISRKGKTFVKHYEHRIYGPYKVPISRKDYIRLQLNDTSKLRSFNRICRAFLEHVGPEYFIVQTHQHGKKYQVALYTDVKPDDGPIEWAENTQLHLAMYELMSEYLWHVQNFALEQFNAEQERQLADSIQMTVSVDYTADRLESKPIQNFEPPVHMFQDVTVGPWTPEAIV